MTVRHDGLLVDWLGYATVRIQAPDGTVVYLDPGRYGVLDEYNARDGDLVCVTHVHHYDPEGIERVSRDDASVFVYEAVHHSESSRDVTPVADLPYDVTRVDDETDTVAEGVILRTIAAYNHADGPHVDSSGDPIHPEGFGCGYYLQFDETRVFWPGDTDVLEGHAELDVSLFLPPIGGTFTMDREGAAALAEQLDPDLVLPIHYDTFEAIETDSAAFAAEVAGRGVPVVLDETD
jgi:L-ascorbate metabolism protein UlaG (beta-lactamase superfamily)